MMTEKKYIHALLRACGVVGILLLSILPLRGQVEVSARLSRDTIWFGDQLEISLRVVQPPSLRVTLPQYFDTIPRGLEVVEKPLTDTIPRKDGRIEVVRTWRVTSFDTTGVVQAGPFEVSWQADSMTARLETKPLWLVVRLPQVDVNGKPKPIKDPLKIPLTWKEVLLWISGALLLLAAVGLLIWWIHHRRRRKETVQRPRITEPPHVYAMRELETLKEEQLWQQGKVKEYYTRLTDILRTYLEYRYHIKALEQTTPETLRALEESGFSNENLLGLLSRILETADLVKFAKYVPEPDVNGQMWEEAVRFVRETREENQEENKGESVEEDKDV